MIPLQVDGARVGGYGSSGGPCRNASVWWYGSASVGALHPYPTGPLTLSQQVLLREQHHQEARCNEKNDDKVLFPWIACLLYHTPSMELVARTVTLI